MPIYAYRCNACGHQKDVLQKMSDAPLSVCPACGAAAFTKQVTAAGFQLKGSGWYVTDFRGGSATGADKSAKPDGEQPAKAGGEAGDTSAGGSTAGASASGSDAGGKASAPAPASAPATAAAPSAATRANV